MLNRPVSTRADAPESVPGVRRHLGSTQCCDRCIKDAPAPDGPPPVPPWETRAQRAALAVLGVGFLLIAFALLTDGPLSIACGVGCLVWTVAGGAAISRMEGWQ